PPEARRPSSEFVVLSPLDVPLVADHPEKCPGGAWSSGARPFENGQAFDTRKWRPHDSQNASNAPVTLVASCERDREDRHTPHRTYRPRSSSPMGPGEAEGTRRTASLALDEASVVGEGRTEPTVEVEAG